MKKNSFTAHKSHWDLPAAEWIQFFPRRNETCVVIPVLNEGDRFHQQLKSMIPFSSNFDILVCDGGSQDNTSDPEILKQLGVCAIIYKTGFGKMSSQLRLLFSKAIADGYQNCVHMDGNGKDDPSCIEHYIRAMKNGYDLVAGSRFLPGAIEENTPWDRKWAIHLIHAPIISCFAHFRFTDTTNSFRGYKLSMLASEKLSIFRSVFIAYNLPYYILVRAPRLGFKCCEIPVNRRYKKEKKVASKIIGFKGRWGILKELFLTILGKYNP